MLSKLTQNPQYIALVISSLVLALFSFHYPAAVSTPLGGDAQTHIQIARYPFEAPPKQRAKTENAVLRSTYPLSSALFASTRVLPFSWETRFTVWMALGHLVTGLLLGFIAWRIAGPWAGSFAMLFWAASTVEVLPFFRAATMPQLWSLPFLLLFIERLIKGSFWWALIPFGALYFAHPATFAVAALAAALAIPSLITRRYGLALLLTAASAAAILTVFALYPNIFPFANFSGPEPWHSIQRILHTHYGAIFFLAPVGVAVLASAKKIPAAARLYLLAFGMLSILLSLNERLGGSVPEKRFIPYAIITVALLGAFGLHHLLRSFIPNIWGRGMLAAGILGVVLVGGWQTAGKTYSAFEQGCPQSESPCPTMLAAEREAYEWIDTNLPQEAVIVVSEARGRATEWIPVIANRGLDAPRFSGGRAARVIAGSCEGILSALARNPVTHAVFYTRWEEIPKAYTLRPHLFPPEYENEEVIIIALPENMKSPTDEERQMLCTPE